MVIGLNIECQLCCMIESLGIVIYSTEAFVGYQTSQPYILGIVYANSGVLDSCYIANFPLCETAEHNFVNFSDNIRKNLNFNSV